MHLRLLRLCLQLRPPLHWLRSPLWLPALGCLGLHLAATHGFRGGLIRPAVAVPALLAGVAAMLAWSVAERPGLGRDLRLCGVRARTLPGAALNLPWVVYWGALSAVMLLAIWRSWHGGAAQMNFVSHIRVPQGAYMRITGWEGSLAWNAKQWCHLTWMIPVQVGVWALFFRWSVEVILLGVRLAPARYLPVVAVTLILPILVRHWVTGWERAAALEWQAEWDMARPLPERLFLGMAWVWGAVQVGTVAATLPVAGLALWLRRRQWARQT